MTLLDKLFFSVQDPSQPLPDDDSRRELGRGWYRGHCFAKGKAGVVGVVGVVDIVGHYCNGVVARKYGGVAGRYKWKQRHRTMSTIYISVPVHTRPLLKEHPRGELGRGWHCGHAFAKGRKGRKFKDKWIERLWTVRAIFISVQDRTQPFIKVEPWSDLDGWRRTEERWYSLWHQKYYLERK